MNELTYQSFEAGGVEESANRYDSRGEILHGPIPNASQTITEIEVVFRFTKGFPTTADLNLLNRAGFTDTGATRNRGREFTGPRQRYEPASVR